jgi:hypothetical protein
MLTVPGSRDHSSIRGARFFLVTLSNENMELGFYFGLGLGVGLGSWVDVLIPLEESEYLVKPMSDAIVVDPTLGTVGGGSNGRG